MHIDLRSDTVTRPCPAMRTCMADAEVGDDVYGEDPSVHALESYAATLLGKEAALFAPSGTMANLLAFLTQTRPGDSVLMHRDAHPYCYEGGNIALVGGLLPSLVDGAYGLMSPEAIAAQVVQSADPHLSNTALVALENTTNRGGGACYALDAMSNIQALAHKQGLKVHCDGARIFNAVTATGVAVHAYAACCDTVSFCLSKGLGAPVGSLLCGNTTTIQQARRYRKMLGGGMRQAGILAAAGLHALQCHLPDLAADHRRAAVFREALETAGVHFPLPSPTNILYIAVQAAEILRKRLYAEGILVNATAPDRIRVVFHRDIDDNALERAIAVFRKLLSP